MAAAAEAEEEGAGIDWGGGWAGGSPSPTPRGRGRRGRPPSRGRGRGRGSWGGGEGPSFSARKERDSNKHKRLFSGEEGSLKPGTKLSYMTTQAEVLLTGTVMGSGIQCECCNRVISCSQFEVHAGRGSRRAPYDNIYTEKGLSLRRLASAMAEVDGEERQSQIDSQAEVVLREQGSENFDLETLVDRCRAKMNPLDSLVGGCVLCRCSDFTKHGFGPRTILLCDQCEREFHVGCLRKFQRREMDRIPEGSWYCSDACRGVRRALDDQVSQRDVPLLPNEALPGAADGEHTWQLLRGRQGDPANGRVLSQAVAILQESFDPIADLITGQDLMPLMVHSKSARDHDFGNVYTAVLRHKGRAVCAATVRVFGRQLAEMPLIATLHARRRQDEDGLDGVDLDEMIMRAGGLGGDDPSLSFDMVLGGAGDALFGMPPGRGGARGRSGGFL